MSHGVTASCFDFLRHEYFLFIVKANYVYIYIYIKDV